MSILYYLSDCMIPVVILYLVGYGMCKKVNIFDEFIEGAKDGFLTVYKILPTLVGLMIGVGILRESGAMEWVAGLLSPLVSAVSGRAPSVVYCQNVFLLGGNRAAAGCV